MPRTASQNVAPNHTRAPKSRMMCLVFISLLKRLPERDGIYFPLPKPSWFRVSINTAQEPLSRLCSIGMTDRNRKLDLNVHCLRRPIVRFAPCQTWVSLSPRQWRMFCHRNGWEDEDGVLRTRPRSQCHWLLYVSGASARDDDRVMNVDRRMPRSNA